MHKMFCVAGLPLREPTGPDPTWGKSNGLIGVNVSPGTITLPEGQTIRIGLPYGPKARLIVLWAISEARSPNRSDTDRWLEIGRIESWLRDIGVNPKSSGAGPIMASAKDQLIRLAFAHFTLTYRAAGGKMPFKNETLFDAGAFYEDDLLPYARTLLSPLKDKKLEREAFRKQLGRIAWPDGIRFSERAWLLFRADDVVPVPTSRLAHVSHSALAIDLLLFCCHTVPGIPPGESILFRWRDLVQWFGNKRDAPSKFREVFDPAFALVNAAYPEANISADDLTDEGLVLRHANFTELRRPFVAVKAIGNSEASVNRRRNRRRTVEAVD
jgi:hypothetical protein